MPGPTPVLHDTRAPTGSSLSTDASREGGRRVVGLGLPLTTGAGAAGIAGVGGGGGGLRGSHRSGTDLGPGGASIPELPIVTADGAGPFDAPHADTVTDTARGVEGRAREDTGGFTPSPVRGRAGLSGGKRAVLGPLAPRPAPAHVVSPFRHAAHVATTQAPSPPASRPPPLQPLDSYQAGEHIPGRAGQVGRGGWSQQRIRSVVLLVLTLMVT